MKMQLKFLVFLLLVFTTPTYAYIHPCPGGWGIDAEFIYLLPSIDDTYFVIDAPVAKNLPTGKRKNNDLGFHPGFRIEGVYAFCECDRELRASYTRLRARETETIFGNFLWATVGGPNFVSNFADYTGSASSDIDILYQRVDGFLTQKMWQCCGLEFYLYGGIEYAFIRVREDIEYRRTLGEGDTFGDVNQRSKAWGVGPQYGVEFDYNLCNLCWCYPGTLSIEGFVTGSLLVSQTRIDASNETSVAFGIDVQDHTTWRIIPAWHARVGLNYGTCFSCFGASIEVGYEFNTYIRAVNWQAFTDSTGRGQCFTAYKNFDSHGLYVNAGVTF